MVYGLNQRAKPEQSLYRFLRAKTLTVQFGNIIFRILFLGVESVKNFKIILNILILYILNILNL